MEMAKRKRQSRVTKSKRGKTKTAAKKHARATASKMAKRSAKSAKKRTKALPKKVTRGSATRKARPRKQKQPSAPAPKVETEILDIVEKPVPGILTVTEIESVRVTVPDPDEEPKTENLPPEEGMAA
jgi:hypothetical protein